MAIIKKIKPVAQYFPELFTGKNHTINYIFNITEDVLNLQITRTKTTEEEDVVLYAFSLSLDVLKSSSRLSDHSYWTFGNVNLHPIDGYVQNLTVANLLSIFDKTFATKPKILVNEQLGGAELDYKFPVRIFVPSYNSKFTDCTFLVAKFDQLQPTDDSPPVNDPYNISITVDVNSPNTFVDEFTTASELLGTVTSSTTLTDVSAGTTIPVTVTCSDISVSILYLESVCGILDRNQVKMTNGSGTFNVLTNTLESGDTVEIKIGYKKYSNVNTFTKTLA